MNADRLFSEESSDNPSVCSPHPKASQQGISLAEMVISIGLLGILLIPMMFMSTAWFSSQLVETRKKMAVSHNVGFVLSSLKRDIGRSNAVLDDSVANSDDKHLYFSYFDPIRNRIIKRGYKLTVVGSHRELSRMDFDETQATPASAWVDKTPYLTERSSDIWLPNTAYFYYCAVPDCSTSVSAGSEEQAVAVKLVDFRFYHANTDTSTDISDQVDLTGAGNQPTFYFSNAQAGDPELVSARVTGLYYVPITGAGLPSGALGSSFLSANAKFLNMLHVTAGTTGSRLSVIFDDGTTVLGIAPGNTSNAVSNNGRVYFGGDPTASASGGGVWSWRPNNSSLDFPSSWGAGYGLSNLCCAASPGIAVHGLKADRNSNRVFFNSGSALYTWKEGGTGLSAVASGEIEPGRHAMLVDETADRLYFGEGDGSSSSEDFWVWKESTGTSTVISGWAKRGYGKDWGIAINPDSTANNRAVVFSPGENTGRTQVWFPGTSTNAELKDSTIGPGSVLALGEYRFAFAKDNEGTYNNDTGGAGNDIWYWAGTATTVARFTEIDPSGGNEDIGYFSLAGWARASSSGKPRIYFGEYSDAALGRFWTWEPTADVPSDPGAGTLSVLSSAQVKPGYKSTLVNQTNGRVFWGEDSATGALKTWAPGGSVTTLLSNKTNPGVAAMAFDQVNQRLYVGENNVTGGFWTWTSAGGLSEIITNVNRPGSDYAIAPSGHKQNEAEGLTEVTYVPGNETIAVDTTNNSVYFTASSTVYLWKSQAAGQKLSVISTGTNLTAIDWIRYEPNTGWAYWGGIHNTTGHGQVVAYKESATGGPTSLVKRMTYDGYRSANDLTLDSSPSTVYAASQDTSGMIYVLDNVNLSIDAYTRSIVTGTYSRVNRFYYWNNAGYVIPRAIIPHKTDSGMSILDVVGKEIHVYNNRMSANGGALPAQRIDLTALGGIPAITTPTGLAMNNRTGDYLVLDSSRYDGAKPNTVRLFIVNPSGPSLRSPNVNGNTNPWIDINLSDADVTLGNAPATTVTNLRIHYNDIKNILYLISPDTNVVYALTLPHYLDF